jgi:hypothetical protein
MGRECFCWRGYNFYFCIELKMDAYYKYYYNVQFLWIAYTVNVPPTDAVFLSIFDEYSGSKSKLNTKGHKV